MLPPSFDKQVTFGDASIIEYLEEPFAMGQIERPKWYTRSELLLIEIHNQKLLKRHGMSRGLELVRDEMRGKPLQTRQRSHTHCIVAIQEEVPDDTTLRRLSMATTKASACQALWRAEQDQADVTDELSHLLEIGTSYVDRQDAAEFEGSSSLSNLSLMLMQGKKLGGDPAYPTNGSKIPDKRQRSHSHSGLFGAAA